MSETKKYDPTLEAAIAKLTNQNEKETGEFPIVEEIAKEERKLAETRRREDTPTLETEVVPEQNTNEFDDNTPTSTFGSEPKPPRSILNNHFDPNINPDEFNERESIEDNTSGFKHFSQKDNPNLGAGILRRPSTNKKNKK